MFVLARAAGSDVDVDVAFARSLRARGRDRRRGSNGVALRRAAFRLADRFGFDRLSSSAPAVSRRRAIRKCVYLRPAGPFSGDPNRGLFPRPMSELGGVTPTLGVYSCSSPDFRQKRTPKGTLSRRGFFFSRSDPN